MTRARANRQAATDAFLVDHENLGTPESQWRESGRLDLQRPLGPLTADRIVIVAPHPDDEVLGAGGLIQWGVEEGVEIKILAVTDGERSYPWLDPSQSRALARRRIDETTEALRRLGCTNSTVERLEVPDGQVAHCWSQLSDRLAATLRPSDWCVAPWRHEGHPDHDVCGEVAREVSASSRARLLSYMVWTWHWARPDDGNIPWSACRQLALSRRQRARKRWATSAFETQISGSGTLFFEEPVLPASVLRRFWRPYEMFIDESEIGVDID